MELLDLDAPRAPKVPLGPQKPLIGDDRMLMRAGLALLAVMTVWRFSIGLISHVIWEESHFVVSGAYPDFGYPDIPAAFPWIARVVTAVFGWQIWPLRIIGLLIATAIPFAVYFLAEPLTTRRNAIWAAIIALLLPPSALNGTIFYPEGALQLLLVVMCGCLIRAVATDERKWWIWAGVCAGIGQLVHFRFLVPGLAVVLFMLINPQGRKLWTRPGPYITAALGVLGFLPAIIYNATHDWPAVQFHVINRPHFDPAPDHIVSFVLTQIGLTTPVFFVALCAAAKVSLADDRDKPDTLLGYQAVTIFLFYVFQATINKKVMPHWPFMAYLPLLPYVPGVLIGFADKATDRAGRWVRGAVIAISPLLALGIGIAASIYQWEFRHSAELPYTERAHNILQNENYLLAEPDLAAATARAKARFGDDIAWAATGHRTAVHLEFPGPGKEGRHIYTLGEPYDNVARFVVARKDWHLDLDALQKDHAGKGVVVILDEPDYLLHEGDALAMYTTLCRTFEDIEPFKQTSLPPGRTVLSLYTARVRQKPLDVLPKGPCPLIPQLYLANPQSGRFITVKDSKQHYGIAVDPKGITHLDVLVDHKPVVAANYGIDDPNFHAPDYLSYDPNYPKVQFTFTFPAGSLTPGEHVLSLEATRTDGSKVEGAERKVYITKK
jgi:hypothetical protein